MKKVSSFIAFILICFAILFTSSCDEESEDVNQDEIYSFFKFSYNASTDKTTAYARFTFGNFFGTRLVLSSGSAVMCNDKPLIQTTEAGFAVYTTEFDGKVDSGKFSWTDTEGKVFNNTVTIPDAIAYPANFTEIDQSASFDLTWEGSAVEAGEDVRLLLGADLVPYTQANLGATAVTLPKARLEKVGKGSVDAELFRVDFTLSVAEKTSAGGSSDGIYTAGVKSITIK